jgi:hypothetical protein
LRLDHGKLEHRSPISYLGRRIEPRRSQEVATSDPPAVAPIDECGQRLPRVLGGVRLVCEKETDPPVPEMAECGLLERSPLADTSSPTPCFVAEELGIRLQTAPHPT